jgi:glycosyltransferase involved in cell wall biosynthesis
MSSGEAAARTERAQSEHARKACELSVIIPTFRRPKTLRATLLSVLAQRDVALEILVVDDCAQGSAAPVVAELGDARVVYLSNPQTSGGRPGLVRNLGWSRANGRYLHFLDDDDRVPPGLYAQALAAFAASADIGVVFGRVEPFGEVASEVSRERQFFAAAARSADARRRFGRRLGYTAHLLFHPTLLVCGAALVRRECVTAVGGFDAELKLMEDIDFYARVIRRFGAQYLDCVALHYRIGPSLMHRPGLQPTIERSYQHIYAKYRREWGLLDFLSVKLFARTVLEVL